MINSTLWVPTFLDPGCIQLCSASGLNKQRCLLYTKNDNNCLIYTIVTDIYDSDRKLFYPRWTIWFRCIDQALLHRHAQKPSITHSRKVRAISSVISVPLCVMLSSDRNLLRVKLQNSPDYHVTVIAWI